MTEATELCATGKYTVDSTVVVERIVVVTMADEEEPDATAGMLVGLATVGVSVLAAALLATATL